MHRLRDDADARIGRVEEITVSSAMPATASVPRAGPPRSTTTTAVERALRGAEARAYAHHRRIGSGGVDSYDHRVGVPHLVVAILNDLSVARVIREPSFSSTMVNAAMLRSLSNPAAPDSAGVFINASVQVMYHRQASYHRVEELSKVLGAEVLKRGKKGNPVLVGDTVDVDVDAVTQ
ncbi:hypothetical protein PR202_gb29147 [Eleusine coracana subsp. coracana]|uniref:Uncharacterized protein n=1 Tax=Eleusine coracana subsp. coracana TaxID=191504 RepID=A0AAV5FWC1_ELECO|nr:hypothetical protein PR202_gb29147 [Eleusine coracana subsp. coracana]